MRIQDGERNDIDSDVRDLVVRGLGGPVAIGTPEFLRARNALELRAISGNPDAAPASSRVFSRSERLVIRFPAYTPDGQPTVSARLLNLLGQPMRTVEVRNLSGAGHEVDLVLAGLATGDYYLEIEVVSDAGRASERLAFRVTS
jgi:hypothetical protein